LRLVEESIATHRQSTSQMGNASVRAGLIQNRVGTHSNQADLAERAIKQSQAVRVRWEKERAQQLASEPDWLKERRAQASQRAIATKPSVNSTPDANAVPSDAKESEAPVALMIVWQSPSSKLWTAAHPFSAFGGTGEWEETKYDAMYVSDDSFPRNTWTHVRTITATEPKSGSTRTFEIYQSTVRLRAAHENLREIERWKSMKILEGL